MKRQDLLDEDERRRMEAADITDDAVDSVASPYTMAAQLAQQFGAQRAPAPKRMIQLPPMSLDAEPKAEEPMVLPMMDFSRPQVDVGEAGQAPAPSPYRAILGMAPKADDEALATRPSSLGPSSPVAGGAPGMEPPAQASKGGPNWDRVSAALYSAFTRKPLDQGFFKEPAELAMRQEELAQRKSHNDFLKDQLRLKYAGKGGESLDPADSDPTSVNTLAFKAYLEGSPVFQSQVDELKKSGAWGQLSKAQLMGMFGNKVLTPSATQGYKSEQQQVLEGVKQTGRKSLLNQRLEYDQWKVQMKEAKLDERQQKSLDMQLTKFDRAMEHSLDKDAQALAKSLPPGAKATWSTGQEIDALIDKLGGPGNVEGVGLVTGAIPSSVQENDVIALRQNINNLVNIYRHKLFGASLTEQEKKIADKAIPMIEGWRSEAEVLHGVQMLRTAMMHDTEQVLGAASPEVKRRLLEYYRQGTPEIFGKAQTGATAPTGAGPAFSAPEQTEVGEPGAETEAPAPAPPAAPAAQSKGTTPKGLPYFKKQVNKMLKKTRFLDELGNVLEEVNGLF